MIRVILPPHLRTLARSGSEVEVRTSDAPSLSDALEAVEAVYPMLCGTFRDHVTHQRRPFVRYFACGEDLSHDPPERLLPEAVIRGEEPLIILGAIAGG